MLGQFKEKLTPSEEDILRESMILSDIPHAGLVQFKSKETNNVKEVTAQIAVMEVVNEENFLKKDFEMKEISEQIFPELKPENTESKEEIELKVTATLTKEWLETMEKEREQKQENSETIDFFSDKEELPVIKQKEKINPIVYYAVGLGLGVLTTLILSIIELFIIISK